MKFTFGLFCILLVNISAHAINHKRSRVPEYRAFPPSRYSLIAQNEAADALGLHTIKTPGELHELVQSGELVPLRTGGSLRVNCPADRAYVRPWVADFMQALAADYYHTFGTPLQVNSATRPLTVQRRLLRWNHNAAPIHGETASVHMRGIAVDIARRGLTRQQKAWLQMRLLYWAARGQAIVEEELAQPCFHTVVLPRPKPVEPAAADEQVQVAGLPALQ
jgi:hypothetical protein